MSTSAGPCGIRQAATTATSVLTIAFRLTSYLVVISTSMGVRLHAGARSSCLSGVEKAAYVRWWFGSNRLQAAMFNPRTTNSSCGRILVFAGLVLLAYTYMNNQQRQLVEKMQAQLLAKERQEERHDLLLSANPAKVHISAPSSPPPAHAAKQPTKHELVLDPIKPDLVLDPPASPGPAPAPSPEPVHKSPLLPAPEYRAPALQLAPKSANDGDNSIPYATLPPADPDDPMERYNLARGREYPVEDPKGLEDLRRFGLKIPAMQFDFDDSSEAQAARFKEQVDEMVAQGMPETHARLRAQLSERELSDRKQRAADTRRRAIIRLRQEVKLRKDGEERKERLGVLEAKQQLVNEMLERGIQEKERAAQAKRDRQAAMEEETKRQKEEAEALRVFREQTRLEALAKYEKENEKRRAQLEKEKQEEQLARERNAQEEKESKRLLMEEFQARRHTC